jgi:hypothetical protein
MRAAVCGVQPNTEAPSIAAQLLLNGTAIAESVVGGRGRYRSVMMHAIVSCPSAPLTAAPAAYNVELRLQAATAITLRNSAVAPQTRRITTLLLRRKAVFTRSWQRVTARLACVAPLSAAAIVRPCTAALCVRDTAAAYAPTLSRLVLTPSPPLRA